MRAVVQRAAAAHVRVDGRTVGAIDRGLCAFVAVEHADGAAEVAWLARKLVTLRLFNDTGGKLDRSVADVGGGVLLVSNFTVAGRVGKGTRPDFGRAAPAVAALDVFEQLCDAVRAAGVPVASGQFGADMQVEVVGDGPVTVVLERGTAAAA